MSKIYVDETLLELKADLEAYIDTLYSNCTDVNNDLGQCSNFDFKSADEYIDSYEYKINELQTLGVENLEQLVENIQFLYDTFIEVDEGL